jgi:hypothetical protein
MKNLAKVIATAFCIVSLASCDSFNKPKTEEVIDTNKVEITTETQPAKEVIDTNKTVTPTPAEELKTVSPQPAK